MFVDYPIVTIGITCYNAAQSIGRAIESALSQNWPNLEIIVYDDFSNDGSLDIIKRYKEVKILTDSVNRGPGAARQAILNEAKGEFLVFFDDDDISLPERIPTQVARILNFENRCQASLVVCYASGIKTYPNGYQIAIKAIGCQEVVPNGEGVAEWILFFGRVPNDWSLGATPSCSLMARVQCFKKVGGFDGNFRRVEDLDFAVRVAIAGGYFIGCKEVLFNQFATEGADKTNKRNLQAELQLIDKHREFLASRRRYFYARKWVHLRFYHFNKQRFRFALTLIQLILALPSPTISHLFSTGPKRLIHEFKMRKKVVS